MLVQERFDQGHNTFGGILLQVETYHKRFKVGAVLLQAVAFALLRHIRLKFYPIKKLGKIVLTIINSVRTVMTMVVTQATMFSPQPLT